MFLVSVFLMKQDADRWRGLSRFEFIFTFVFVYAIPNEPKAEHRCMQFVRAGDELRIVEVEIEGRTSDRRHMTQCSLIGCLATINTTGSSM